MLPVLVSTTYYHQYGMTLWVTNESPYEPTLEREVPMAMSPWLCPHFTWQKEVIKERVRGA
jgi:hypothetical protein